ncbi:MAG: hypothetical protein ACFUZC_07435 [Chthoniobacteraceae bacterium]
MASLPPPKSNSGFGIKESAPKGTYICTCLLVRDEFGVMRKKYQSEELAKTDVTRFLFGFVHKTGKQYFVETKEMKISSDPKSALFAFLKSWLGEPPKVGWDYCTLIGSGALVTVELTPSSKNPGQFFSNIGSIAPVMDDLKSKIVPVTAYTLPGATAAADGDDGDVPF